MKKETLQQALNEISPRHIAEAANAGKKRKLYWLGAIAAVMALVLVARFVEIPMAIRAGAVSLASEPRVMERPRRSDYAGSTDPQAYSKALSAWSDVNQAMSAAAETAVADLSDFFKESSQAVLGSTEANALYSPINAYIGLALAAELTAGETRRQLLDALGAESSEALRTQVSTLWGSVYEDDGNEICVLANSLWLDQGLIYRQEVMDSLGYDYYCSVYQRDLSSSRAAKDIGAWLTNNTGGFLKSYTSKVQLPPETILALYSTIYFQSKWTTEFNAANNTQGIFHAPGGDTDATYMNQKQRQMYYYWGDSFGAVALGLKNSCQMWLILPDEDKTIADVLAQGQYLEAATAPYEGYENSKYVKVNLSVPKFDISTQTDLRTGFEAMGITDLFDINKADFSASLEGQAFMTAANQAVRVAIDEVGVTAAAYIEFPGAGAAAPPEEIIDFVLDRPFLFLITGANGEPLFAGTVNQP